MLLLPTKEQEENFERYKSQQIRTLEELIQELNKLPKDTKLSVNDGDIGGYDVSTKNYLVLDINKDTNTLMFRHLEYETFEAYQKGKLTYEHYQKLNDKL